ncbi:MAG: type II secretion system protein [Deltaproteobacteria bacterium]|nr:type II secretion system protein [Deltaproteobacteria bacterium]
MTHFSRSFLLVLCLLFSACASHPTYYSKGDTLYTQGRYDEALLEYAKAVIEEPDKHEYRTRLYETKSKAALVHFQKGKERLAAGLYQEAVSELIRASMLDPSLEGAGQKLKEAQRLLQIDEDYRKAEELIKKRKFDMAKNRLEKILAVDPENNRALGLMEQLKRQRKVRLDGFELDVISTQPITLKFKDAALRDIFTVFSKLSGVNFIFDDEVPSRRVSILLEKATFSQALELLLKMNNLGKKVLNEKTIILYPKNIEKVRQYEDQIIQIFYLSNVDAKKVLNLLRTMLQLKKIYVHEELNAIVIRDQPEVIKLAQKVIAASDRADSEVVFDVEIVEVGHNDIVDLGPTLSTYSVGLGLSKEGTGNLVSDTLDGSNLIRPSNSLEMLYTLPRVVFDFAKTLGDSEILANPKIRVKNREKAKVHIGSREPVVTTSTNGDLTYSNVQYVDVGVKLDVEPTIQLDETIVTKLGLEVSNVSSKETVEESGTTVLTITTTNAQTTLTLKDGEQTIIGGLIRDDFKDGTKTIPVLGDIPGLGRLFSGKSTEKTKIEILLSITPHVVQSKDVPSPDVATIWSGGENDYQVGPSFGAFAESVSPVRAQAATPYVTEERNIQETSPASATAGGPPRLFIKGPAVIRQGDLVPLSVDLSQADKVYGVPLQIVYDPDMLDFMGAEEGPFLGQNGQRTLFTSHADGQSGRVHIANSQLGKSSGASGAGSLVKMVFRARRQGQVRLVFDKVELHDAEGRLLPVKTEGLSLRVD